MTDVIFDIDGTIADIEHRRGYVRTNPKNWNAFNAAMVFDKPNLPIIDVMRALFLADYRIILCSARGEENRDVTEQWLRKNFAHYYSALYMRKKGDNRKDSIVKYELLQQMRADGYSPSLVFDDRNQVVDMWRENGLVCAQVAPGDF